MTTNATTLTDDHRKKQQFTGDVSKIPAELRKADKWLLWEYTVVNGDIKKLPKRDPGTGKTVPASVTDRGHWRGFAETLQYARSHKMGIGLVLTTDDDVVSIDLDHCIELSGKLTDAAREIVERFRGAYIERSPSETGLHIWCRGQWPDGGGKRGGVEVYKSGHYLTFTAKPWGDAPATLPRCDAGLAWLRARFWLDGMKDESPQGDAGLGEKDSGSDSRLSDDDLLERATSAKNGSGEKFRDLMSGNWQAQYPSQSEADGALCCLLAFWSRDPEQIDRLFRQSALFRPKWDEQHGVETYGASTIKTALLRVTSTYHPTVAIRENSPIRCTDVSAARIFAKLHGCSVKFSESLGWLTWDGRRWLRDDTEHVPLLARDVAKTVLRMVPDEIDPGRRKELLRWANALESDRGIKAMLSVAQSEPGIVARAEEFDTDLWLLNVRNGTLDLKSGELRRHDPQDMLTKFADISHDLDAECPRWTQFVSEVMDGDKDLVRFLQMVVGYSLTGSTREQAFFFCHGAGANGKSVFLDVLGKLLGDYGSSVPFESFLSGRAGGGGEARADLARLRGVRFCRTTESEDGRRLNTAVIKELCGGDRIACRQLYRDYTEFKPVVKIWFASNFRPQIADTSEGTWRRLRLIPWRRNFSGAACDKDLPAKLERELSGILTWAVAGCRMWQAEGLPVPKAVEEAGKEYRFEESSVLRFLSEETVPAPDASVHARDAFVHYRLWAENVNETPVSMKAFSLALARREIPKSRTKVGMIYRGLRFRRSDDEDVATA